VYRREHYIEDLVAFAKRDPEGFFDVYMYYMVGAIFFIIISFLLYLVNKKDSSNKEHNKTIEDNIVDEPYESVKPWKCKSCSEVIESQFDVCWNCQTPKV